MVRYLARRLVLLVPVLLGVSVLVFVLIRLIPGDVVDVLLGNEAVNPEIREQIRSLFGLDAPMYVQYGRWLGGVLHGDFGVSLRTGQPITTAIGRNLPVTVELALLSVLLSSCVAIPLGILSALKRSSVIDLVTRLTGLIGLSFPSFWLATMLLLISSLYFRWLPPPIFVSLRESPAQNLAQMALPTISLAAGLSAIVMRMTRSAMLEVLRRDYVRTARAKGLPERAVVVRHALKNAMIPVITVIGVQAGYLLGGAVVIEQIFSLPGLGWLLLNGVYQRDYPMIQATVLLLALFFVLTNLLVDLAYALLDPRIRYG
jgi:peptide/nickel transport system permease protein